VIGGAMHILIVYATTEGQTGKVASFCAERLTGAGHRVEVLLAGDDAAGRDPAGFDAAILAASVHLEKFQPALVAYAKAHARALAARPTLFLPVSLSAAGTDAGDWEGLHRIVAAFETETGWHPGQVVHVAGAFRFVRYNWLKSMAMRWIAAQRGQDVDGTEDKEYTDWDALGATLDAWAGSLGPRA
jgi:menaquinone-dependent protoporphyrinogen oxidase